MSVAALVFSRDRAAQLDLLLRSLEQNAPGFADPLRVLWRATDEQYERAYVTCAAEHPDTAFVREESFGEQVPALLTSDGSAALTFFTDDSVLFRPLGDRRRDPVEWLAERDDLLCFSLRLGRNCESCYPLSRSQRLPAMEESDDETIVWRWRGADGDFGYPGSLDGHVFRRETVLDLVAGRRLENPNGLEGLLALEIAGTTRETMAAYRESHLVGLPVNRVNDTHPNRFGEQWPYGTNVLNARYLEGHRLDAEAVSSAAQQVDAAHAELPLRWQAGER